MWFSGLEKIQLMVFNRINQNDNISMGKLLSSGTKSIFKKQKQPISLKTTRLLVNNKC